MTGKPSFHWLQAAIVGCTLGATNSLCSGMGSPYGPVALAPMQGIRPLEFMAAWLGTAWAYALLGFAVGWSSHRPTFAAIEGTTGLISAVAVYYLTDWLLGLNVTLGLDELAFWSLVALMVGPLMGAAGWAAHHMRWWSIPAGLSAPTLMIVDTALRPSGPDSIRPWGQWIVYSAAAVLGGFLMRRAFDVCRNGAHAIPPDSRTD